MEGDAILVLIFECVASDTWWIRGTTYQGTRHLHEALELDGSIVDAPGQYQTPLVETDGTPSRDVKE